MYSYHMLLIYVYIVGLANGRQVQKAISDAEGVGDSFLHARMEEER